MIRFQTRRAALQSIFVGLALLGGAGASMAQDPYDHDDHRHRDYHRVRHFGVHGHVEGGLFHIRQVTPGSGASRGGLFPGDRIYKIDGDRVLSISQFSEELREAREDGEDTLEIQFYPDGQLYVAQVPYSIGPAMIAAGPIGPACAGLTPDHPRSMMHTAGRLPHRGQIEVFLSLAGHLETMNGDC